MDKKYKHMEIIQSAISRMASNSFALKGWAVTLVAGIFVLASKDADKTYFLIAYVPIIVFWALDAYYLLQERLFRALYNWVINLEEDEINFSMDTSLKEFHGERNNYFDCLMSKTVLWFYLPLAFMSAGITIITYF